MRPIEFTRPDRAICEMGYALFPLTPALSPGERENRSPSVGDAQDGVWQANVRRTRPDRQPFPAHEPYSQVVGNERMLENRFMGARRDQSSGRSLPEGEGQGEAELDPPETHPGLQLGQGSSAPQGDPSPAAHGFRDARAPILLAAAET